MAVKRLRFEEPSSDEWGTLSEKERDVLIFKWVEYYREHYGKSQLRKFFLDWVDDNVKQNKMDAVKAGMPLVTPFEGSWARIMSRGYSTKTIVDYFHNKTIPRIVEYGERILAEKKLRQELLSNKVDKGKEVYRPSIQERISDQTRLLLAEVECEVDTFLANDCKKSKFDLYKFLQKNEVKGPHTKKIQEYLNDILDELVELLAGKDDQLNEGYSFLTKTQKTKYCDFTRKLVSDAEAWGNVLKSKRKPRTKKIRSLKTKTAKVKYKERDDQYKIASVSPTNIVDAAQVWLFSTKDRFLYRYISNSGIVVKGTTMYDWDASQSFKKKIRKPETVLPDVINGGKIKLRKLMDDIHAKEGKVTGRINKDMIILRVVS